MIYILVFILSLNLYYSYKYFKTIVAPPILVGAGMLFASFFASLYYDEWEMGEMLIETFIIVGGGTIFFSLCCVTINKYMIRRITFSRTELNCFFFNNKRMICFYIFVDILAYLSSCAKIAYLRSLFGAFSLPELMALHHMDGLGENDSFVIMPTIPRMISSFSQVVCFASVWCLALMVYSQKKSRLLFLLILLHIILVIYDMMLSGSKGSMITMPIAFATLLTYFHYAKTGRFFLKRSFFIFLIISLIFSATLFKGLSLIVGRDVEDRDTMDLFAGYCGAEIKNLDIYLHRYPDGMLSRDFGANTFNAWYNEIGVKAKKGVSDEYHEINGFLLGNVRTQYHPYHVDFGILGVFMMMILLSTVSMYVYSKSMKLIHNPLKMNVYILLYASIMSLSLFMAFFSSKMTENIFRPGFLRMIIYTIFIVWFFRRFLFNNQIKVNHNKDEIRYSA